MGVFVGQEGVLCTLFTLIINESCTSQSPLRSKAIGFYFAIFALGGMILSLLTYVIQDSNTLYLMMVLGSSCAAIPVPFLCFEPIKQLYKRGKVSELFLTLHKMSQRNRKNITIQEIQLLAEIEAIDMELAKCGLKTVTTFREKFQLVMWQIKLLFAGGYLWQLVGYFFVSGFIWIIYSGVTYNSGQIGLPSVQLDVILLAFIEAVCYSSSLLFVSRVKRNRLLFWCFAT